MKLANFDKVKDLVEERDTYMDARRVLADGKIHAIMTVDADRHACDYIEIEIPTDEALGLIDRHIEFLTKELAELGVTD
jgi:hypothetical protein